MKLTVEAIWLIMTLWTQTLFKYNITNIVNEFIPTASSTRMCHFLLLHMFEIFVLTRFQM